MTTTTTEQAPLPPPWRRRLPSAALVLLAGVVARGLAGLSPCVAVADHLEWREYMVLRREPGWQQQPAVRPDPWGRPYEVELAGAVASRIWSRGPDGVDQGGEGDDVPIYTGHWNLFFHREACVDARRWSMPIAVVLAALVLVVTAAQRAALAPRARPGRELLRACVMAAVPAMVWLVLVDNAGAWVDRVVEADWTLVRPRTAVSISGVAACVLAALALRTSAPEPD